LTGRGSGQSARSAETCARILRGARKAPLELGPGGFSMRAVAGNAGISLCNVQFHYRDQAALLSALLQEELTSGRQRVDEALSKSHGRRDALERVLDALLAQQCDQEAMRLYLALWSLAGTEASVREVLHDFYARFVGEVVALLRLSGSSLGPQDLKQRAQVAVALLEGLSLFRSGVAGHLPKRAERLVRTMLLSLVDPTPNTAAR